VFGDLADNPNVAPIQVDGTASAALDALRGTKPVLNTVSDTASLIYAGYSGVGKLEHTHDADSVQGPFNREHES
jgi:hypothetical protein